MFLILKTSEAFTGNGFQEHLFMWRILGLHSIYRDSNDKVYGGHVGVMTKECNYNSIVIVHQYGGYDIICKPRIITNAHHWRKRKIFEALFVASGN